jgi:surface protein
MIRTFSGATAFSQTLCWDTSSATGSTTDMFVSSGGSIGEALTDANFITACNAWVSDNITATATYCAIQYWNTGAITDMSSAFAGANTFNDDISLWDTSSVITILHMFRHNYLFNQPIGAWDVSQVADMSAVFGTSPGNVAAFNQDLSMWDTSKVSKMGGMFANCIDFNQDIGNWDVKSVTEMQSMFYNAVSFNGSSIGFWDVSQVTTMESLFYKAEVFNADISTWNTSSVTSMHRTFAGASVFNQDIGFWTTRKVLTFFSMFFNAHAFNQDLAYWDTSSATTMERVSNKRMTCCLGPLSAALDRLTVVRAITFLFLLTSKIISCSLSLLRCFMVLLLSIEILIGGAPAQSIPWSLCSSTQLHSIIILAFGT